MKFGKTIKIFLIEGDPSGRMTCELSNWTGKAYKIPRIKVKDCNDREDLKNPGIYLLFGKDESGKDLVYIGETEVVLKRILQHLNSKDFWNETILFISKDENLNKAHIKYMENRLYEIAQSANRYVIINNTTPTQSSISESDIAEMEEFINNIKILVNTLGHKVFEKKREIKTKEQQDKETFHIDSVRGAKASGEPTSDGFLVHKGSKIAIETTKSYTPNLVKLREKFLQNKFIKINSNVIILQEDYLFSSPSAAASIVMGRNANGLNEWKLKDGITLKEFESGKQ